MNISAQIGECRCGDGDPLLLIAGPCVVEGEDLTLRIAETLVGIAASRPVSLVFKASFDKANRTSLTSFRGLGEEEGLRILELVKRRFNIPVTTDIHLPDQAASAAEVVDLLQIPAFLCRQTDLLIAAGRTGRAVSVKKGQFLSPEEMRHPVDKLRSEGCGNIVLCERGTFFGYGRLVNDFGGLSVMRSFGVPVIFDATHSVQLPGGAGGTTGGNRALVAPLARAAIAIGIDGLFLETHPDPDRAPSDGPNMVPLDRLASLLDQLLRIREAAPPPGRD